ncbi:MAG: hypothetical protein QMD86_01675 [Patescibacteria group bacterium]|nr:hypothetical protein [Patescibacteria group bacterium]
MENTELHPLQEKIYKIYKDNNGRLPTFRELSGILKVSSLNTVSYHINQLKKKGFFKIENEPNGIVELNLKNLLNFENKKGVYVLLKGKNPFYVDESENIKNDLIKKFLSDSRILDILKNSTEKINIAYYLLENAPEREDLKNHLFNFYKEKGFNIS